MYRQIYGAWSSFVALLCNYYVHLLSLPKKLTQLITTSRDCTRHVLRSSWADESRTPCHIETERNKSPLAKKSTHLLKKGTSSGKLRLIDPRAFRLQEHRVLHVDDTLARGSLCALRPRSIASRITCCHETAHDRHEGHEGELYIIVVG
jgi:hypothetical protein